jgi:hypothetical protein
MAATSGIAHGGKRNNSGRKRKYERSTNAQKLWNSQHKRVYLSLSIFSAWNAAKTEAGYALSNDSEFTAHLLSLEYRRRCSIQYIIYICLFLLGYSFHIWLLLNFRSNLIPNQRERYFGGTDVLKHSEASEGTDIGGKIVKQNLHNKQIWIFTDDQICSRFNK